jgi:hypothetical protein
VGRQTGQRPLSGLPRAQQAIPPDRTASAFFEVDFGTLRSTCGEGSVAAGEPRGVIHQFLLFVLILPVFYPLSLVVNPSDALRLEMFLTHAIFDVVLFLV